MPLRMFVRFRQANIDCKQHWGYARRVVKTRRVNGKIRHEHVASLGSIENAAVAGRIAFWQQVHERLAKLGIDHEHAA